MSPPPASPVTSASNKRKRVDRANHRSSIASDTEKRSQTQRSQRATWACERCRIKKLRCTGGRPCSACERAGLECDFGDRGDSNLSISLVNQRLEQLEKTLTELVASSTLPHEERQPPGSVQPEAYMPPYVHYSGQAPSNALIRSPSPQHHVYRLGQSDTIPCMDTPTSLTRTYAAPPYACSAKSVTTPLAQSEGHVGTSDHTPGSTVNIITSEGVHSRWSAVENTDAPFPPLMAYPSAWSKEAAKNQADEDSMGQPIPGMSRYTANVHLRSEPIADGIVTHTLATSLFDLFCQYCHPSFPILGVCDGIENQFDRIRSASPFLFTVILSIASCYYNNHQNVRATGPMPSIAQDTHEALADLACAHLGFVIFRKQHQLSDVQAAVLLSVWIPRGRGQSADQWLVTGICTRLAYRIGVPDCMRRPAISKFMDASSFDMEDAREVNKTMLEWHTWLLIKQYDTSLSLGFGRPHALTSHAGARQYLEIVRKLGRSSVIEPQIATYVVSLTELSEISTALISGLHLERLQTLQSQDEYPQTTSSWARISTLLSDLNPRLDEWERQWTWNGSYDAISMGNFISLCKIYGEHTRLCLNSLSLNLLASHDMEANQKTFQWLVRACESAVTLVQYYAETWNHEPVVRYSGQYLALILGQATIFLIRTLAPRLEQPAPMDRLVLGHYLKMAVSLLESNNFSTVGTCTWIAQISRALAHHAGVALDDEHELGEPSSVLMDHGPELECDFGIPFQLDQNMEDNGLGLNLGHYFDFAQSYYAPPHGPRGL